MLRYLFPCVVTIFFFSWHVTHLLRRGQGILPHPLRVRHPLLAGATPRRPRPSLT